MLKEIFGRKIGMTQLFDSQENAVATTLVKIDGVYILEKVHNAKVPKVKIGCFPVSEQRLKKIKKPVLGYFNKLGVKPYQLIQEVEIEPDVDLSFLEARTQHPASEEDTSSVRQQHKEGEPEKIAQEPKEKETPAQKRKTAGQACPTVFS